MRSSLTHAAPLVLALVLAGAGAAQAQTTTNVPMRSGEASTMTDGVPNLLASNVQPGELGLQTRLTVRPRVAAVAAPAPDLKTMGASRAAPDAGAGPTGQGAVVR